MPGNHPVTNGVRNEVENGVVIGTYGYLMAAELADELDPKHFRKIIEGVLPQLSKHVKRIEVECLGKLDIYDERGERITEDA